MVDPLALLERRYGTPIADVSIDRLRLRLARNREQRRFLDTQIKDLIAERDRLASEDERLELTLATAADDVALRVRIAQHEGWSPHPVIGYRMWEICDDRILGATGHLWPEPHMEATCDRSRPSDDLPHSDFPCSPIGHGCGIYAASSLGRLEPTRPSGWVLGIVLLTGKVVEHDHGYRAARARVAAVVAQLEGRRLATADIDALGDLFASPAHTIGHRGEPAGGWYHADLVATLEDLERSLEPWT